MISLYHYEYIMYATRTYVVVYTSIYNLYFLFVALYAGFSIEGPSQAKIECDDNGDGSADIKYHPTAAGEYAVHILCDQEDIPNSPYIAQILPNTDYYPDRVSLIHIYG